MASLIIKPNGRYSLQFTPRSGRRRPGELKAPKPRRQAVALGQIDEHDAKTIKRHVEELVKAQGKREPDTKTAKWRDFIAEHDDDLYRALLRVGLVPERKHDQDAAQAAAEAARPSTLARFVDDYIRRRGDVKGSTATVYSHTRRCLVEFFGATRGLDKITSSEAEDFRRWLATDQKLADNTVRRRCGIAKQFFRDALRRRLIAENPFADMKGCAVKGNAAREYFVTRAEAVAVLDACPDAEWRLLFALSRYGGLRCPSEHLGLKWSDIDWAGSRMTVRSPKTEHHEGKESRVVPIFPELLPHLREVYEQAEEGAAWVITRYRDYNANLRTQLERIIAKAGLKPWPKLFQNLRSTRETELAEEFPIQVVCEWIGNSEAVAKRHYLQITEDHFRRATSPNPTPAGESSQSHFRTQNSSAPERTEAHQETTNPGFAGVCVTMRNCAPVQVGVEGLEPPTSCV